MNPQDIIVYLNEVIDSFSEAPSDDYDRGFLDAMTDVRDFILAS